MLSILMISLMRFVLSFLLFARAAPRWSRRARALKSRHGAETGGGGVALDAGEHAGGRFQGVQIDLGVVARVDSDGGGGRRRAFDVRTHEAGHGSRVLRRVRLMGGVESRHGVARIRRLLRRVDVRRDDGDVEVGVGKARGDGALDSKHFSKRLFVAVTNLKFVPRRPEICILCGIAKLRRVRVQGARAIDLAEFALKLRKPSRQRLAHVVRQLAVVRGAREDVAHLGDAEKFHRLGHVDVVHPQSLVHGHALDGALVHVHRPLGEAVILFEFGVRQEKLLRLLRRGFFNHLLEQVSRALEFRALETRDEEREIRRPQLARVRKFETIHPALEDLKRVFKEIVLLEQVRVVQQYLRRRHLDRNHLVVHRLGRLQVAQGFFQVDAQRPHLERFENLVSRRQRVVFRRRARFAEAFARCRRSTHHRQRLVVIFVPQVHLCVLAPTRR
mmetsp:Transcript_6532/g.26200  ORF Transcript_6532/g.26200 Transcript_6532/m.26200 type:complete len:445 (-) Transcript_6532:2080-3414(-)